MGLACIAGAALVFDRFVLQGGGPAAADAAPLSIEAPSAPAAAEAPVRVVTVADRLAAAASSLPQAPPRSAFALPEAWAEDLRPSVVDPPVTVKAPEPELNVRLSAIIRQGNDYIAMIDGLSYRAGNKIKSDGLEWTISTIHVRSVTFTRDETTRTVELAEPVVGKSRAGARPQGRTDEDR